MNFSVYLYPDELGGGNLAKVMILDAAFRVENGIGLISFLIHR